MNDSHSRTGSFHECAEVLADLFAQTDAKMVNYKKVMNGMLIILSGQKRRS